MTAFPALEAALDAAAHGHYRRRRRLRWRVGGPVLALACVVALTLLLRPTPVRQAGSVRAPAVPAATLQLSHALTLAPVPSPEPVLDDPVAHADLPAIAAEYERRTPYPPSGRDTFDWAALPADPHDMASFNYRRDIQMLVEFRAGCLWMRYWLATEAHVEARRAATAVLADIPAWPARRHQPGSARAVAEQAAAGNAAAVAETVRTDCSRM